MEWFKIIPSSEVNKYDYDVWREREELSELYSKLRGVEVVVLKRRKIR